MTRILICQILIGLLFAVFASIRPLSARAEPPLVTEDIQKEISTQEELMRAAPDDEWLKEPEATVEQEKEKPLDPPIQGPAFDLKEILLQGNTIFTQKDLAPYLKDYVGRKVSFTDLRDLTLLITNHYRSRGYATSRAFIPVQKIKSGTITIEIIEGKVGKTLVEGNKWLPKKAYSRLLNMREGNIFKIHDLESGLRRLNSSSDRFAKAYLIAGEKPLTSDVILKAKDRFPVHAGYEFNNRGTKLTHRARHEIFLRHSNLLGFGDSLNLNLTLAEQYALFGSAINYRFPIYATKTFFSIDSSITQTQLAKHLREFKIKGKSWSFVPGIQQILFETQRFTIFGNAAFEIKDSKTAIDEEKISFDRMRVFKFGPSVEFRDPWGRNNFAANAHIGIPGFLGGSPNHDPDSTRENSGGKFAYYTANYFRAQRLPYQSLLFLKATAQLADEALPSAEQFRAGGYNSVRGYPEGDSAADHGFSYSAEFRLPPYFIPKSLMIPKTKKTLRETISLIGFIDGAYVGYDSRPQPTNEKVKGLLGAGYGIRFNWDRYTAFMLDIGYPIGVESSDKNRPHLHMSIRSEY